jgi:WD40 repeat protein
MLRRTTGGGPVRHPEGVISTAFLADGRVVAADRTGDVRVWGGAFPVTLSARGRALQAHPSQNLVAVRDAKRLRVVDADADAVRFDTPANGWFDFTPDGKVLAVADGPTVKLFAVGTWEPAGELAGHEQSVGAGVFTADGLTLYTGALDRTVVVWDVAKAKVRERWKRDLPLQSLWLTADGEGLIESSPSRLSLTDTSSGETRRLSDAANSRPILIPTYDPTLFASTSTIGEVQLRTTDGSEPKRVYRGHAGVVLAATISRDGKWLLTGGEDGTVRVWDLTTSPEYTDLATLPYITGSLAVSPDGSAVATASRNVHVPKEPDVLVLDPKNGEVKYRVPGIGDVGYDPRGRWLATGRLDATISLRDPADGHQVRTLAAGARPSFQVVFRPDGGALAAVEMAGKVRVWDTDSWGVTEFTPPPGQNVSAVAWSPDGTRMVIAAGLEVVLWTPATGAVGKRLVPANTPLVCEFGPDGKTVAVAGRGRSLELFDAATGDRRLTFVGNPSVVNGLAFHPTGPRLASVGVNGFVRVWDTESGKEVLTLNGGGDLFGVGWSPDGKRLFAAGSTVRRWSTID